MVQFINDICSLDSLDILIDISQSQMQISLEESHHPKKETENYSNKTDQQLNDLYTKIKIGCKKIFHRPGYKNSKGDAPYDFTCDSSHLCQKCDSTSSALLYEMGKRETEKTTAINLKKVEQKIDRIKKLYFCGKPGCGCKQGQMCQKCLKQLQQQVTKYEKGCGKQWVQEFGGMAAGPAYVTCADNYFLCDTCSQQLSFIARVNKEYPHVVLKHLPELQKQYWSPSFSNAPYYSGLL